MFTFLKILFLSVVSTTAFKCYTPKDVYNQGLVSYQGKVYDLSNYNTHPAGKDILLQTYGKPLESFFNMNVYKFHVGKSNVKNDFKMLFVGDLYDTCTGAIIPKNVTNLQNITYDYILDYNLIKFGWYINDDIIYFISKIKIYNTKQWIGIQINNSNNVIIAWLDNLNRLNIDIFNINTKSKSNISLLHKTIFIENKSVFKVEFSNYINKTDININEMNKISYYIGDTFMVTNILKNFNYTDTFYANLRNGYFGKNDKQVINLNNDDELIEYYPSIGTSIAFIIIFLISLVITHSKNYNFFNYYIDLKFFGYYSYGTIIFSVLYLLWWISIFIYCFAKIEETIFRLGIWVSLNMAFNLLPITRNSIWVVFFNLSYDRLIFIHKLIGVTCLISVIVKLIAVSILYNVEYLIYLTDGNGGNPLMGTLATLFTILTSIVAIPQIKNNMFEVFFYFHKIFCFLIIIAGSFHYITVLYYLLPSIILYLIDLTIRYFKTHKAIYTRLDTIGLKEYGTSCILINITVLKNINTKPGSYFFICYDEITKFEWHPLSLISQDQGNLLFCIKDMGHNTWSNKLKKYDNKNYDNMNIINRTVYIQGPYGHLNLNYEKNNYKYILIIAGGIGITPMIPILNDINSLYNNYKLTNMKKIYVIWVVKHSSLIIPLKTKFSNLNEDIFKLFFYSTNEMENNGNIHNETYIRLEKPNITNIINNIVSDNKILDKELAITCCGPCKMANEVVRTCSKLKIEISVQNF